MWYFAWILGVGLASSFAILNAMWFEMKTDTSARRAEPESRVSLREADSQPSATAAHE
jgi:cyd operon protein YbgT